MSKLMNLYTCHEKQIDKDGNETGYFTKNLPHGKEVAEAFITSWNKDAEWMCKLLNEQGGDNRVESCRARQYKKNGRETTIAIEIVSRPGKQFRSPTRERIFDFFGAQFSDGWGEGFFGLINPITAEDGTVFCVE